MSIINYDEFLEIFRSSLPDYFSSDEYSNYSLKFGKVKKVNRELDSFSLIKETDGPYSVAPTLYVQDFYEEFVSNLVFENVLEDAADALKKGIKAADEMIFPAFEKEFIESKVVFQVVNYERNKEMLSTVVHRRFLDLAIIYRVITAINPDGIMSCIVSNSLLESLELREEDLYECAYENTRTQMPFLTKDLDELVEDFNASYKKNSYGFKVSADQDYSNKIMYFVTNRFSFCAASALLYNEIFKKISDEINNDIYILPSSVNDLIVVPIRKGDNPQTLARLVSQMNSDICQEEDVLSDNIYAYFRQTGEVEIPYV